MTHDVVLTCNAFSLSYCATKLMASKAFRKMFQNKYAELTETPPKPSLLLFAHSQSIINMAQK